MTKILKIDKALYEVDDKRKTYGYYGRSPNWKNLDKEENERNKKGINGYVRIAPPSYDIGSIKDGLTLAMKRAV